MRTTPTPGASDQTAGQWPSFEATGLGPSCCPAAKTVAVAGLSTEDLPRWLTQRRAGPRRVGQSGQGLSAKRSGSAPDPEQRQDPCADGGRADFLNGAGAPDPTAFPFPQSWSAISPVVLDRRHDPYKPAFENGYGGPISHKSCRGNLLDARAHDSGIREPVGKKSRNKRSVLFASSRQFSDGQICGIEGGPYCAAGRALDGLQLLTQPSGKMAVSNPTACA